MEIIRSLNESINLEASVLAMGTFDGLHRGHQQIIRKAVTAADTLGIPSVLITFDPHPRHILKKTAPKLPMIVSIEKKLELLKDLGLDYVLIVPFTDEFSLWSPDRFLNEIVIEKFHPKHIIIGYDHHFGRNREGSPEYLTKFCKKRDIDLDIIAPVSDQGINISSSHIRQLLRDGFVRRASFELGWIYGFSAKVVHGAGRGRTLHFPTANFVPLERHQILPKSGVYFTRGRVRGQLLYGMCNLGVRPTFDEGEYVMEVHFFDENIDGLYNQTILIEFLERIRDENKFPSRDALIKQLTIDRETCLKHLEKYRR